MNRKKSMADAPNYHPVGASGLGICQTCKFFATVGFCAAYSFRADPVFTCDTWAAEPGKLQVQLDAVRYKHAQHDQSTHGGGGGSGGAKLTAADGMKKFSARAAAMGKKIKYEKAKNGMMRAIDVTNPRKPKPTRTYVEPSGRVVNLRNGKVDGEMTDTGWRVVSKEASPTPTAVYGHGPGGLFSMPGRKRKAAVTTKPGMAGGPHGPSIKNPRVYEALRRRGMPKGQAAAISNAQVSPAKTKTARLKSMLPRHPLHWSKGNGTAISVFKDTAGDWRWVILSSNAYRDRDGEIVSTKALREDVERTDQDGDYGPLRFWHVPGLDLGDCDFSMVHSKTLVESGTFYEPEIGEAVYKSQDDYQASLGFRHPPNEPDRDGVFNHIRRFERSLVPDGKAANPFTSLLVTKESKMNDQERIKAFKSLMRSNPDLADDMLAQVESREKTADSMGIKFKAADWGVSGEEMATMSPDELLDFAISIKEAQIAEATKAKKAEDDEEEEDDEFDFEEKAEEEEDEEDDLPPFFAKKKKGRGYKAADFYSQVEKKMAEFGSKLDEHMKMHGRRNKSADADAVTLDSIMEVQQGVIDAMQQLGTHLKAMNTRLKSIETMNQRVLGEAPEAATLLPKGGRASQSDDNLVPATKGYTAEANGAAQPADAFVNWVAGGVVDQPKPLL